MMLFPFLLHWMDVRQVGLPFPIVSEWGAQLHRFYDDTITRRDHDLHLQVLLDRKWFWVFFL